ncbi:hypothetical protein QM334_38835, partial [Burkholderia cenocepacia]|nr:hypothetical protein [Burkholderia cenocepacia]
FAVAPSHPLASLPEPLAMASVVQYRGAVISDTSRELQPQSVAIDAGQPYLAVPTLAAKLEAQCEGLAVGTLPECIAPREIAVRGIAHAGHLARDELAVGDRACRDAFGE